MNAIHTYLLDTEKKRILLPKSKAKLILMDNGKNVEDSINELNSNLATVRTYVNTETGKLHFVDSTGADTELPFKSGYSEVAIFASGPNPYLSTPAYNSVAAKIKTDSTEVVFTKLYIDNDAFFNYATRSATSWTALMDIYASIDGGNTFTQYSASEKFTSTASKPVVIYPA